jgi:7-cyano-7-deazaguanine synthase
MLTNDDKALVVLSGGQDSTTCLFWALKRFKGVAAITFSYGQRHIAEVKAAEAIAKAANVDWELIDFPLAGSLGHNSLTSGDIEMDKEKPADSLPNTFVPGRNLFFLSIAAVYARERGIRNIVTGVGQTDFSGYPDCRDSFIRSLNVTLNLAMDEQFIIHTPLMWLDKEETWAMADSLGVLDIVREKTVTCYNGVPGEGCGECPACKLRRRGLQNYLDKKAGTTHEQN